MLKIKYFLCVLHEKRQKCIKLYHDSNFVLKKKIIGNRYIPIDILGQGGFCTAFVVCNYIYICINKYT